MRTIRAVLRLRLDAGLSERHTARSLGVPRSTVQDYCARFGASGLLWPLAAALDDVALEQALFVRDLTPPKYSSIRTCDAIQSGSCCVHVASAYVKLLAPSAATKICATRTSPVAGSVMSTVTPA